MRKEEGANDWIVKSSPVTVRNTTGSSRMERRKERDGSGDQKSVTCVCQTHDAGLKNEKAGENNRIVRSSPVSVRNMTA